jgi:hypothetical protein
VSSVRAPAALPSGTINRAGLSRGFNSDSTDTQHISYPATDSYPGFTMPLPAFYAMTGPESFFGGMHTTHSNKLLLALASILVLSFGVRKDTKAKFLFAPRLFLCLGRVGSGRIICCLSSPAQTFLLPSPAGLTTVFHCLTGL